MRYRLSLGPFHPGWPGALRLDLEVEEGIVRAAESVLPRSEWLRAEDWAELSLEEGLTGVGRLCAASSWAYTMAYCQALEELAGLEVPPRGGYLRVLLAELERSASHLLNAAKLLRLAGLLATAGHLIDMWEDALRTRQLLTGHRFFTGLNVPGGLRQDVGNLAPVLAFIRRVRGPLYRLVQRQLSHRPIMAQLVGAGLLTREKAEEEGLGGPVARATELDRDVRRDQPYAAYASLDPQVVTQGGGGVFSRWMVLVLETFESLRLMERVVQDLPVGPVRADGIGRIPPGETRSRVEAPAGPLIVRVQVDQAGRLAHLWRTAPSQVLQAVLPKTLPGQQLDLIGVIVASWGLCPPCLVR